MRGKETFAGYVARSGGITPAHAGKSQLLTGQADSPRDHPRTCGEKLKPNMKRRRSMGSPPHMRGKARKFSGLVANNGITPAHAGKSPHRLRSISPERDHPRTCGEKVNVLVPVLLLVGSPPHMRGKDERRPEGRGGGGITPAHAGKSFARFSTFSRHWDHPRTCGEKCQPSSGLLHAMGSPPHMRGKGTMILDSGILTGITPAHAGKSYTKLCGKLLLGDHPRTCGEKAMAFTSR